MFYSQLNSRMYRLTVWTKTYKSYSRRKRRCGIISSAELPAIIYINHRPKDTHICQNIGLHV